MKSLSRVRVLETLWTAAYKCSSIHGIFQARVLEWGAIAFSKGDTGINIKSSKGGGHSLEKSTVGSKTSVEARNRSIPIWLEWNWEGKALGSELGKTRKVRVGQASWALLQTGFYSEWGSFGDLDGKESACNAGDPVQSLVREDSLEKQMSTHFCILAWRIPCV